MGEIFEMLRNKKVKEQAQLKKQWNSQNTKYIKIMNDELNNRVKP